jgi:hypothetical protein
MSAFRFGWLALLGVLVGCQHATAINTIGTSAMSFGGGADEARPKPVNGWDPAYDEHIRVEARKASALLQLSPERMTDFCPAWASLDQGQRAQFFADLLYAISLPESGRDRRSMYNETGIVDERTHRQSIDPVTGRPILSEGLLQLSYADARHYPPSNDLACAFDFEHDRDAFDADLADAEGKKSLRSQHPERSILDPYVQFSCALHILDELVRKRPSESFSAAAGRYWSTMRPRHHGLEEIRAALAERHSPCLSGR